MKPLDLYLIPTRTNRYVLFSPPEMVEVLEAESGDRVRQGIDWLMRRKSRAGAWVGRMLSSAHAYYVTLEDRIDPAERIVKAMAATNRFVVHTDMPSEFPRILKRQRWKHIFWFSIDFVISGVVLVFTVPLALLPGPNVFFYYPFLRLLSHYRAILGATSGLRSGDIQFKSLPELSGLEDNLSGLARFLERMGQ